MDVLGSDGADEVVEYLCSKLFLTDAKVASVCIGDAELKICDRVVVFVFSKCVSNVDPTGLLIVDEEISVALGLVCNSVFVIL